MKERGISENVKAVWGFGDGHVEISVRLPFPASLVKESVEFRIEADEVPIVESVLKDWRKERRR